jgi:UMF1 family MFS transporter
MSHQRSTQTPRPLAVGSWVLYDLANTIYSYNIVSVYLALWVTQVMGGTDGQWAYTLSLSMAIIFVMSPILGALTDQASRRMPFLVISTLICVGFTLQFGSGSLTQTLTYFVIANVAYQAGLQFYDALLPDVSTEDTRGRISGIGVGVGYMGAFLGLAVAAVILGGVDDAPLIELAGRYRNVFLATGILFLVFAIPCFLFVKERGRPDKQFSLASVANAVRQVGTTFRHTRRYPGLLRFLVGRMFYTDAVNTVIFFLSIYIVEEIGFGLETAQIMLGIAIAFAVVGGLAWGRVVDRIGPKQTLTIVLRLWMVVLVWAALVGFLPIPNWTFWPVPILAGIAMGGTWTSDRPLMLRLTPPARIGEFYGLYGMVGRFAAIVGPLLWALVVDVLGLGRPTAIVTLLVVIVISHFILQPLSDEPRDWPEEDRIPV